MRKKITMTVGKSHQSMEDCSVWRLRGLLASLIDNVAQEILKGFAIFSGNVVYLSAKAFRWNLFQNWSSCLYF